MRTVETDLAGVFIVEPSVFEDPRGTFFEHWNEKKFAGAGLDGTFVQDNISVSGKGVLRGLHFQYPRPQAKLVSVLEGEVLDVVVDIGVASPSFGKWMAVSLSGGNRRQLWIPDWCAHGFCVLSDSAIFLYKCSDYYSPPCDAGIRWNDPDLKIPWPVDNPVLSEKDRRLPFLKDVEEEKRPRYRKSAKSPAE